MVATDSDISRPRLIRVLGRFPQQSPLKIKPGSSELYGGLIVHFLHESGWYPEIDPGNSKAPDRGGRGPVQHLRWQASRYWLARFGSLVVTAKARAAPLGAGSDVGKLVGVCGRPAYPRLAGCLDRACGLDVSARRALADVFGKKGPVWPRNAKSGHPVLRQPVYHDLNANR